MGQRSSVLIGVGIPIALVIALFTWGVIQNDGSAENRELTKISEK